MNPLSSLGAGVLGAFTPCALVLIPLVLARFTGQKRRIGTSLILFLAGFLLSFSVIGLVLEGMFQSHLKDGFSFGLGILFMGIGALAFTGRLNIANAPVVRNAFLAGIIFALAGALNPCTAPFLGIIISLNSSAGMMFHTILFGLGLITPALIAGIAGTSLSRMPRLSHRADTIIQKIVSAILIMAGAFLVIRVDRFTPYDSVIAAGMILFTLAIIIRSLFIITNWHDLKRPLTLAILLLIAGTIIGGTSLCLSKSMQSVQDTARESHTSVLNIYSSQPTCNAVQESCQRCADCMTTFAAIAFMGAGGLCGLAYYNRDTKKK